jgi:hypothetical protein
VPGALSRNSQGISNETEDRKQVSKKGRGNKKKGKKAKKVHCEKFNRNEGSLREVQRE